MGTTSIEWTASIDPETGEVVPGKTWNPIKGCSRVSQGCTHCYAETIAARFSDPGQAFYLFADRNKSGSKWTGKVAIVEEHLQDPLRWRKPTRVFVNSMSDLFHEGLSDADIDRVFDVMESVENEYIGDEWSPTHWHTFQILTKRPERMREYMTARLAKKQEYADKFKSCPTPEMRDSPAARYARAVATGSYFKQIWLGVSVEDQKTADERIPQLLRTPAAVRFVSYEPALASVHFERGRGYLTGQAHDNAPYRGKKIDWVICGFESGRDARPGHPEWARKVRDECVAAGTAFFFKQWGQWIPRSGTTWSDWIMPDGRTHRGSFDTRQHLESVLGLDSCGIESVGKKAAGSLLDGRQWHQFPGASA